ncbi:MULTISPECIES: SatD family protein [Empedobacter]|uniref:Transcriptional regulator n=1 Tax=Empedobacter falsenii TaxID=343874 RepID=A0A3R8SR65_9FLAO|nr:MULTISPECIES: SatD family protein [Empedobacter]MDH1604076.1 SatD family protein [Empedobacter sp. GD03739]RRT86315.1 transcriptional regulator [Empedobacter falsenii]RRT87011.1 transcriptional regulator [Empedobacter falsenii]
MIAVITGDIINSRKVNADEWLPKLKEFLANTTNNHEKWEIYRGDSFQIQVEVNQALETALCIKALIKTNSLIDVRMSIGIGECTFQGENITESNGSAFIHSGEAFEKIKKNTLILKTPFDEIDEYFNPILKLVSFIADNWKPVTSETIFVALSHQELIQKDLAEKLKKDKPAVNRALKRGGYEEILEIIHLFNKKIALCMN